MIISILTVEALSEGTVFKRAFFLVPDLMDTWFVYTKVKKKIIEEKKKERAKGSILKT